MIFLESFPEGPSRLPSVFLIKSNSVTLLPINQPPFLCDGILVLEGTQKVFDCGAFFVVNLNTHFTACF